MRKIIKGCSNLPISFVFCHMYQLFPIEDINNEELQDRKWEKAQEFYQSIKDELISSQ